MSNNNSVSAGAIVVRRRFGQWSFLVLRAGEKWSFPAGPMAAEEPLDEAVRRCCWQVAALLGLRFYWGHHYMAVPGPDGFGTVRFLIGESAAGDVKLTGSVADGGGGFEEYRWVYPADATELLPLTLHPLLEWAVGVVNGADGVPGIKR